VNEPSRRPGGHSEELRDKAMTTSGVLTPADGAVGSSETTRCIALPPGFVRLAEVAPGIVQDIVYASPDNFTGRPVPGYEAADCWLREEAAHALARVAARAEEQGVHLVVYDGYRPQRAVDAFVKWADDPTDELAKAAYYPDTDKSRLIAEGYIGLSSFHSTGLAVDVGLLARDKAALDFGTPFDFFGPRSATAHPAIGDGARINRLRLLGLMEAESFENYPREWWHFRLCGFAPAPAYDLAICRP
jgi:D-alanyl-D-alanine dipeptidase